MINLFQKSKSVVNTVVNSLKDDNAIIKEIHSAFDSSTDYLLKQANEILSRNVDISKGEKMASLGFISANLAVKAKETVASIEENKKLAEKIEYYKTFYPNYKFITEKLVAELCKRYGLICGESKYYIGDIPNKNLSEIENFKIRNEDCIEYKCCWLKYECTGHGIYYMPCKKEDSGARYGYVISLEFGSQYFFAESEDKTAHYEKPPFKICAPVKDFNTRYMRIEDGYKLANIPDPIVLQPVNDGYLIISKWGLGADDKDIVNEKLN